MRVFSGYFVLDDTRIQDSHWKLEIGKGFDLFGVLKHSLEYFLVKLVGCLGFT